MVLDFLEAIRINTCKHYHHFQKTDTGKFDHANLFQTFFFAEQIDIHWYELKSAVIKLKQSQTKNKTSLPYYVHVMRDKIQNRKIYTNKRKEKLQADIYLRKRVGLQRV